MSLHSNAVAAMQASVEAAGMTTGDGAAILMVFLEPAPYIIGFVEAARAIWPDGIDVVYAAAEISQRWDQRMERDVILPAAPREAINEIRRRIDSGRYGLVHLAGWGHPLLWRTLFYAAWRIPVTVQTDTPAPRHEPGWKWLFKKALYPVAFRIPAMFTPAGTPQAVYLASFGVPERRIRIAQLTVDVAAIQTYSDTLTPQMKAAVRSRLGLSEDDVALLYLGRLEPHKGIDDLLSAFALLARDDPKLQLLIAGEGSLRDRIVAAAAHAPNIHYLGRLSGDAVWDAYNTADIFVLPSHFEPWGLVVNEALAAGLPVVVSDRVGSGADLVRDGVNGRIVQAESPVALAEALAPLLRDPDLRRLMGVRSRELISGWTLANQARNTAAAWRHVLAA